MSKGRIGAGGPFLVTSSSGDFQATVKLRPILVVSLQTNIRSILRYRLKTKSQLGKPFGKRPIFPVAIWVTTVSQKRIGLNRRFKTKSRLSPPRKSVVVIQAKFPEAITVLRQTSNRQKRFKTLTKFIDVFGKPTTKPGIQELRVLSQAVNRARIKTGIKSILRKPVRLAAGVTTLYFPPSLRVVGASQKRINLKSRLVGKTKYITPVKVLPTIISFPEYLAVLMQGKASKLGYIRRPGKTKLGKVFGRTTTKVRPKPIKIVKFASLIAERKAHYVPVKIVILAPVPLAQPAGHTVVLQGGLWVADGLTYHKGLSRPTVILTPVGGGLYNVVKVSSVSDELADQLGKQVILIDGELP